MQAAAVSVNEGSYFEPTKLTVKEWFETWLSEYMADKKPLTVTQYRSMSETHIFPALGAVKLKDLKAPQLQQFYNQLAKDGKVAKQKNRVTGKMVIVKTGEPLSAKSIKNIHGIISKALNTAENPNNPSSTIQYIAAKKNFLIVNGYEFNWFMPLALILLILSYIILYKTRFGLRLMACGEHPQAADSVGINVRKMRYAGVMISGLLGGLGGLVYITAGVSEWKFENGVAGFGFLALAVMIFGGWKPTKIALAALLFGLFRSLSNVYTGFPLLNNLNLPSTVYNMLPYIISLIVLIFFSANSAAPKAEGIPYDKGSR